MYIHKRFDRQGKEYYSFSYDDHISKKRIRLKKEEHPLFRTAEEARVWADSQDAQRVSRLQAHARREAWKTTYYDFEALVIKYRAHLEVKQPRSYEMYLTYFEQHAMNFFIGERQASNVNNWHLLFPEFRDWVQTLKTRTNKTFAVSSRNHVIVSVNNFLAFLGERGLIAADSNRKCSLFALSKATKKNADSVVSPEEFKVMELKLRGINSEVADVFTLLFHTGLRFNEMLGLSLKMIHAGHVENLTLTEELVSKSMNEYYGYIFLNSQPETKADIRDDKGHIERVPLKGRKSMTPEDARTIPIFDKDCWNILARRHQKQETLFESKEQPFGKDQDDYVLFNETFTSTFSNNLMRAYAGTGYISKTPHELRHSYCTNLVGKTRSLFLARLILGHRTEKVLEGYLHVYDQINRAAQKATRKITVVD